MRPVNISGHTAKEYYYEKDPLFNSGEDQHNSEWVGDGAELLGLAGAIRKEDFENILDGMDPQTGRQIVRNGGQDHDHRAGTDIPFSAPKSVSYQALIHGDNGLIDDFRASVRATVEYIEQNYSYYRETREGITEKVQADNLTAATFLHSTSRADDPNLHCHTVIANIIRTQDASYKALDNDQIYRHQVNINRYQQSDFARRVQERGYEIETKANGTWEISGIRKEVIDIFSKRSKDICNAEERLKEEGAILKEGLQNKVATLDTRPEKNKAITKEDLLQKWQDELKALGHTKEQLEAERVTSNQQARTTRTAHQEATGNPSAEEYVRKSIELKHQTESTFQRDEILNPAYAMTYGRYSAAEINHAFKDLEERGEIQKLDTVHDKRSNQRDIYTTPAMQQTECHIIESINAGKGQSAAFYTPEDVQAFLARKEAQETTIRGKDFRYSPDQKRAIETAICSRDRVIKIQGRAGAGKTSTMSAIKEFYEDRAYRVSGTAWSNKAVEQMRQGGLTDAETVTRTLKSDDFKRTDIVIIDEAGTLDSRSGEDLLRRTENAGKVIAYGDTGQNPSIGAGRGWKEILSRTTTDTVEMSSSQRFTTPHQQEITDDLERASGHFRNGDLDAAKEAVNAAIDRLKDSGSLSYADSHEDKINQAVEKYFQYRDDGKTAFVQSYYNHTRKEINERIHDDRVDRGEIESGDRFKVKEPVNISAQRSVFADAYQEGQIIRTHDRVEGFRKGDEATITSRDTVNNTLTVQKDNGKIKEINLHRDHDKFTTYNIGDREFSEGDRVMFRDNDRNLKINNAEMGTIKEIDRDGNFTVEKDGRTGETVQFNIKDYDRIDHAYSGTTPHTQGADFDATVKVEPQNCNDFNTAVTRGKEDAYVIADKSFDSAGRDISEEYFREKMGQEAEKTSTLDFPRDPEQRDSGSRAISPQGPQDGDRSNSGGRETETFQDSASRAEETRTVLTREIRYGSDPRRQQDANERPSVVRLSEIKYGSHPLREKENPEQGNNSRGHAIKDHKTHQEVKTGKPQKERPEAEKTPSAEPGKKITREPDKRQPEKTENPEVTKFEKSAPRPEHNENSLFCREGEADKKNSDSGKIDGTEKYFSAERALEYSRKNQEYKEIFEKAGNPDHEKLAEIYGNKFKDEMSRLDNFGKEAAIQKHTSEPDHVSGKAQQYEIER